MLSLYQQMASAPAAVCSWMFWDAEMYKIRQSATTLKAAGVFHVSDHHDIVRLEDVLVSVGRNAQVQ